MNSGTWKVGAVLLISFAVLNLGEAAERVASIFSYKGQVGIKRAATGKKELVKRRRTPLFEKDMIVTGANSTATIMFEDASRIDLSPKTSIQISGKGRKREIAITAGGLRSDIKKVPGVKTNFRTPAGVAAVKGTLVECVVKSENKIEIAADLGLLTHEVGATETAADLDRGRRLELSWHKETGTIEAKSLKGDIEVLTKNLSTELKQDVKIRTRLDSVSDNLSLSVIDGEATTRTERGTSVVLDQGDAVDFVQTGSGTSITVIEGTVTVIDARGGRFSAKAGETVVEMPGMWLEPETPEGPEVMIPPGT